MADGGAMRWESTILGEADWMSVEAIVRGWTAHPGAWIGTGGGPRLSVAANWERAAFACRRLQRFDLALLLWSSGVDEAAVGRDAIGILRADAARIEAAEREFAPLRSRCWPRGRRQALAWLAAHELRPRLRCEGLSDADRLAIVRLWPHAGPDKASWSKYWARRYWLLIAAAERRIGSALICVRENREKC